MKQIIINTIAIYICIIIANSAFRLHIPTEIAFLVGIMLLLNNKELTKGATGFFKDIKDNFTQEEGVQDEHGRKN